MAPSIAVGTPSRLMNWLASTKTSIKILSEYCGERGIHTLVDIGVSSILLKAFHEPASLLTLLALLVLLTLLALLVTLVLLVTLALLALLILLSLLSLLIVLKVVLVSTLVIEEVLAFSEKIVHFEYRRGWK